MKINVKEINLTSGPVRSSLIRFSLPVILSMVTAQLYSVADTMIIGNFLDAKALAAVSNAVVILMLFLFVSGGLELGASLIIATRKPVSTGEELSDTAWSLLGVTAILGIILVVPGVIFFPALLRFIHTPDEIISRAALYGRIYFACLTFQMVYDVARQILIAMGDSRRPMFLTMFTSCANLILDLILVGPFGIGGTAAATAISQTFGCFLVCFLLKNEVLCTPFRLPDKENIRSLLTLAPPNMLQQASGTVITMVKQTLLGTFGTFAIAGFSCSEKLTSFLLMPVYGFVQAVVTFIAQNDALGQRDRIRKGLWEGAKILFAYAVLIFLICEIFRTPLLKLFTQDENALHYGGIMLLYTPFTFFFTAARHLLETVLRGKLKMRRYLISNMGVIGINILFSLILVPHFSFNGFWLSGFVSSISGVFLAGAMVGITLREEKRIDGLIPEKL